LKSNNIGEDGKFDEKPKQGSEEVGLSDPKDLEEANSKESQKTASVEDPSVGT